MAELAVEETLFGIAASEQPRVVVHGVPVDASAGCREGGGDGPAAVREASRALESYSPALDRDLSAVAIADLGDVDAGGDLARTLEQLEARLESTVGRSRLVVLLGGEHTISVAPVRVLLRLHPDLVLVHVDAHADLRPEYEGEELTRASWIACTGIPLERVVQVGIRSLGKDERALTRRAAHSSPELELPRALVEGRPLYVSIDIDVLDPAAAPGVRCPEPGGPSTDDLIDLVHELAGLEVIGFDVVEVAPATDPGGLAALAAAKVLRELILTVA